MILLYVFPRYSISKNSMIHPKISFVPSQLPRCAVLKFFAKNQIYAGRHKIHKFFVCCGSCALFENSYKIKISYKSNISGIDLDFGADTNLGPPITSFLFKARKTVENYFVLYAIPLSPSGPTRIWRKYCKLC